MGVRFITINPTAIIVPKWFPSHTVSQNDTKGKEQRGEFKEFSEDEYVSYSVTFAFASKQQQIDAFAALNLGELADKYSLALSIYNPGMFYLKDVVISEVGDIPPPATYQVRMSAGTTDAESWTISPTEATTVSIR